jgi:Zn-dependent protease with chaperone function
MRFAVYLPLLAAATLGACAPALSRRLPPATGTRLLTGSAVLAAAATSFVLAVLAFTLVGQLPLVATLGHWSGSTLAAATPVPAVGAAAALLTGSALAVATARAVLIRARAMIAARALCQRLGGRPGQLVVIDDDAIDAFAVPAAGGGRIVASRLLLQSLPPAERRAVLTHESAHLAHHHHLYRLAAELAAAVNPLLRPVARGVHYTSERWADEVAAATVGDRKTVATALARTSLNSRARTGERRDACAPTRLAITGPTTVARVQALLRPAPQPRRGLVLGVLALLAATLLASGEIQRDTEHLFKHVMRTSIALTAPEI